MTNRIFSILERGTWALLFIVNAAGFVAILGFTIYLVA